MSHRGLVLAVVLAVVAAPVGIGAATSSATSTNAAAGPSILAVDNATATPSLGQSISAMMQSSTAQAAGTVENGMWAAAYANASNASSKRALVEQRTDQLNMTVSELRAQRRTLRAAYRNGSIDRTTYLARLSTIVGRLAALGEAINAADERGKAVGVNRSKLQALRHRARNLSGPEVSRLARNLTGGQGPPGPSGLFGHGPPGDRGPGNATNRSTGKHAPGTNGGTGGNASDGSPGQSGTAGNATQGNGDGQGQSNATESTRGNGQNASDDRGNRSAGGGNGNGAPATATPTES